MKKPFLHQRLSFKIITTLIIFLLAYLIYRRRISHHEKRERKLEEINEKLKAVDKLKDRFVANTSHELRTPIHGIIGISEMLLNMKKGEVREDARYHINIVRNSANRLLYLINDILDFEKMKSSEINLKIEDIALSDCVDTVLCQHEISIRKKLLDVNKSVGSDVFVRADRTRLEQIFHNLIGNAVKFTESGGIFISSEQHEDFIRISVEDTGPGMSENDLTRIFKPFEQGEDHQEGTGLGLSITKSLVEVHGGEMAVESILGRGSKFSFTLEKTEKRLRTEQTAKKENKVSLIFNPPDTAKDSCDQCYTILSVDDDPVNQEVVQGYLNESGYRVKTADDGKTALDLVENEELPDIVLLDIMIPGIDGYEVCRRIRKKYSSLELPIIMVTARNQTDALVEGFRSGANDYLTKPFSKNELIARIDTHIGFSERVKNDKKELEENLEEARDIQQEYREKYRERRLDDEIANSIISSLKEYMERSGAYKDPEISLKKVARKIFVKQSDLSQAINDRLHLNFHQFVNSYRIEEVKGKLASLKYKEKTILEIAYESGFTSKSGFNVRFKQMVGMTPSQFRKSKL